MLLESIDRIKIRINKSHFCELDNLIAEKVIKIIYEYFYSNKSSLRSKKIQLLIKSIKIQNSRVFNIKGMLVKNDHNVLVFCQKNMNLI